MNKIVIVGRPNVGKSTLFNKIVKKRRSVIDKVSSTTRDRVSEVVSHNGILFELIDTGGLDFDREDDFYPLVEKQVKYAIEEASVIIFVCSGKDGVMPLDELISGDLRKANKKIVLCVNKIDNKKLEENVLEFYNLGIGEPFSISGLYGKGIIELLDLVITKDLQNSIKKYANDRNIKLAIVGRPNAGKSLFVNKLLREERVIVSEKAGTTRDSIDTYFKKDKDKFTIIDTAGIISKSKIKDSTTYFSIMRTHETIRRSDSVVFLMDGILGITKEDFKILEIIQKELRPFVLAVNKWDLCKKTDVIKEEYAEIVREHLRFTWNAPLVFISSLNGEGVLKVIDKAHKLSILNKKNFSYSLLKDILKTINIKSTNLISVRQIKKPHVEFEIFARDVKKIKQSEKSHIMNRFRKELKLDGIPIKLVFKSK